MVICHIKINKGSDKNLAKNVNAFIVEIGQALNNLCTM